MSVELVTGDTGSVLQVTCTDNDTAAAIDLTGATVTLRWEGDTAIVEKTMTIDDAAGGVVSYQFLAGEIISPKMKFEVEITDSGGYITTNLELIEVVVREELG
jgi:hypothetical protein